MLPQDVDRPAIVTRRWLSTFGTHKLRFAPFEGGTRRVEVHKHLHADADDGMAAGNRWWVRLRVEPPTAHSGSKTRRSVAPGELRRSVAPGVQR